MIIIGFLQNHQKKIFIVCDGSDLNIFRNPKDFDNYFPNGPDNKGFRIVSGNPR